MAVQKKAKGIKDKGGSDNRLFQIKHLAAVWIGKILVFLTRLAKKGGTTLPGRVALKVDPGLITTLSAQMKAGTLVVTGTNGKTTTSALISLILKENGMQCIHNQSGSNLSWGVASALISAVRWPVRLEGDWALMEADEAAFPQVVSGLHPQGVVATNIFRDQLDRYGEIDRIQAAIAEGFRLQPADGFEVINADDPSLLIPAGSRAKKRFYYGFQIDLPADTFLNTGRDAKACPRCGVNLVYEKIYYAHLGHYYCPACLTRRPAPDVRLTNKFDNPDGTVKLEIAMPEEMLEVSVPLPGTYNIYNILAAVTCATALSIPAALIKQALRKAAPSFGRMELFEAYGKKITMALIKNPVGANEVLRTILEQPGKISLVVAINDRIADGTDVSWLWDVDFEQLSFAGGRLSKLIVTGLRAWDMAVRLKYAGLDPAAINIVEDTARAIRQALAETAAGEKLVILPTYTAMLEMRRHLNRLGLGKAYWEAQ